MDDMRNILVGDNFIAVREPRVVSYWPELWRLTPESTDMTEAEMDNFLRLEAIQQAWG
jgi:hypothetical protein